MATTSVPKEERLRIARAHETSRKRSIDSTTNFWTTRSGSCSSTRSCVCGASEYPLRRDPAPYERRGIESLSRDQIREMVRQQPAYQEGHISDEQAEEIVEEFFERQEELLEEFVKAEVHRELIRMLNRGELEYDPEAGTYRMKQS